ncbi:MAG: HAMP domain-containing protein, partial [Spirochaetia bacterium]|nr:HAMP domain-containing protein [Spirochaetia bacterium]
LAKEAAALMTKFKTAEEEYLVVIRAYRQWKNRNDLARIKEFQDGTFTKLFEDLKKTMGDIASYNKSQADALAAESKKMAVVINSLVYSGMFGGTALALLIGILLSRAISRPIVKLEGVAKKVADGDISFEIKADSNDEIGSLTRSFAAMSDNLNNILGQIQSAVEQVAAGSKQVSDSSQALSQSATEQASSLEEITASITELSSQTKQNAENATQANQLASVARSSAEGGNSHMLEMVKAMGEIDLSSQNISKIIKVIDEIAFQTNLLALNAAVEAARAGVHGKGFAVVAQEVRNLAARSAKAAKETADMIEGSIKRVNLGSEIANKTAASLTEIVAGVGKVTSLVAEIAAASNEQAQGINQVNAGLGQLDQVTQQNTASAEESASASEELSGQAVEVRQLLSRFVLRGSEQANGNGKNGSAPHQLIRHAAASVP